VRLSHINYLPDHLKDEAGTPLYIQEAVTRVFGKSMYQPSATLGRGVSTYTAQPTFYGQQTYGGQPSRLAPGKTAKFAPITIPDEKTTKKTKLRTDKLKSDSSESEEEMGAMPVPTGRRVIWSPGFE